MLSNAFLGLIVRMLGLLAHEQLRWYLNSQAAEEIADEVP
jgi:hypothetical protein